MLRTETLLNVMGCFLYSRDAANKIIKHCKPDDFPGVYSEIFEICARMIKEGKHLDLNTLIQETNGKYGTEIAELTEHGFTDDALDTNIGFIVSHRLHNSLQNVDPTNNEQLQNIITSYQSNMVINQKMEIVTPGDVLNNIMNYFKTGGEKTYSTGFSSIDNLYKISKGQFSVITGIPGSGKSSLLDQFAINFAKNYKFKTMYYSPENFPPERHLSKLVEMWTGWPFRPGPTERMSEEHLKAALKEINEYFTFIKPDEENRTLRYILQTARTKEIDILIIDPWNEIEHSRPAAMSETEYIGLSLGDLKAFSISHNVHIFLVAHPRKIERNKDGEYPVPTPYDISGSAHFRNKADNCITVHRPDTKKHEIEFHVQKIRFKDNGMLGTAKLYYNPVNGQFSE